MQDELEDLRDCGIGGCKPKILKPLANIKVRGKKKCMNERAERPTSRLIPGLFGKRPVTKAAARPPAALGRKGFNSPGERLSSTRADASLARIPS